MLIQQALKISGGKDGKMQKDVKNMRNKMYGNVWVEFCLGFVPVVGALADTAFRANARNAGLLEELLAKRLKELELEELDAASSTSDRLPRHDTDLNRKPNLITTNSKRQQTAADRYDGIRRKGTDALDRAIDGISKDSRKPTDPKHDKNRKQSEVSRRPTRTSQNPTFF